MAAEVPMPAGYDPAWISFNEAVHRVMRAAGCDRRDAIGGIVAASKDGQVASRYGDTHEAIDLASWGRAGIAEGYLPGRGKGYVLIAIVPRPGEIPMPRELHGPTSMADGVPRVDRAWSFRPVELNRKDLERLWTAPSALRDAAHSRDTPQPIPDAIQPSEKPPLSNAQMRTTSESRDENGRNTQRGPSSTAPLITRAAQTLVAAGKVPGKTITWKKFQAELCRSLNVAKGQRGYSIDSIQKAVRPLLNLIATENAGNTESTET
jgi:hypothetical protein